MFFNNKKKPGEEPVIEQPLVTAPEPAAPVEEAKPVKVKKEKELDPAPATVIGKGITFYGDFTGEDPIVINGSLRGDISTKGSLTISEDGSYTGNAKVSDLESNGRIRGNIVCDNQSVLGEKSAMKGHLVTSYLTSKTGSSFIGQLDMTNPQTPEDDEEEEAPAPVRSNTGFSGAGFAGAGSAASKRVEPVEFDWHPEETARRNAKIAEENARLAEEAEARAQTEAAKAAEAIEEAEDELITVDSLLKGAAEETAEEAEKAVEQAAGPLFKAAEEAEKAEKAAEAFMEELNAAVEKAEAKPEAPASSAPNPFLDLDKGLVGDIKIPDVFNFEEEPKK
ncbi:MAG: polymer-forming cytoskeletal protein [Firmicutes bacterium]|nr:polymer-forming cytoskeletal protein [Bacillota bacterium]